MGINEWLLVVLFDVLEWCFGFEVLCYNGYNVVEVIVVMFVGKLKVFIGLGGNFV